MLNVGKIEEGLVLDHIKAGKSMGIYKHLGLGKSEYTVALIKNARSNAMGKKDILKVECDPDVLNLDVIAFIDPDITVNIIRDGEIVEKRTLALPKMVTNVIRCTNPRCISTVEQELPQVFYLADAKHKVYRCRYCDEKHTEKGSKSWFQ